MDEKELSEVALKSAEFVMKAMADKDAAVKAEAEKIAVAKAEAIEEYKKTQEPAWKGGVLLVALAIFFRVERDNEKILKALTKS